LIFTLNSVLVHIKDALLEKTLILQEDTMKQLKFVLIVFILFSAGLIFAQTSAIGFRDTTQGTKNLILLQDPSYPNGSAVYGNRFLVQMYKSIDDVIDPLSSNGQPTGDDIQSTLSSPPSGNMSLLFTLSGTWSPSNFVIAANGSTGNTWRLDKVYLRIFNSTSITTATKYIQFNGLYTVPESNFTPSILVAPINNWNTTIGTGGWVSFASAPVPNPAVLVAPANGGTGLGYAGTGGGTPTGHEVYFGTNTTPGLVSTQTGTTYNTGELLQNQTYFWKIIPYNNSGSAINVSLWSFTTRSEISPAPATNPSPANGATVNTSVIPYIQTLSWSAPSTGVTPTGYKLYWNYSQIPEDLGNVLSTTISITDISTYSWQIVPYYIDPGTRKVTLGKPVTPRLSNPENYRGDAGNCPTWTFTVNLLPTYTVDITSYPSDADIFVSAIDSGFNTPHTFSLVEGSNATYTVQKTGFIIYPTNFVVTNIQANTSKYFQGTSNTGPTLPITQGFEGSFPPNEWIIDGFDHVQAAHGGLYGAGTTSVNSFILSPKLSNPGIVTFWNTRFTSTATFSLQYATDIYGSWISLTGYPKSAASSWQQETIDLTGMSNIFLRWILTAGAGPLYIDDIIINRAMNPNITVTGALSDFGSVTVGANSTQQSYSVSAIDLSTDLVVTAPSTDFQVSLTSTGGYASTVNIAPSGGTIPATSVYIRFSPQSVGAKSGNVTNTSTGATPRNVAVSGTGINNPAVNTPTASAVTSISAVLGGNIVSVNFSNVTERGIYYSTTNGFADGTGTKVSETGSFGTGTFTVNVGSLLQGTTYYFKAFATNAAGISYTAQASFGTPGITVTGSLGDFGLVKIGNISTEKSFIVSGVNLNANIIITPPSGYQISTTSGSGFGVSMGLLPDGGSVPPTTIFVRFVPSTTGVIGGNLTITSTGATTWEVTVTGTGIDNPVITSPTSASVTGFGATLGGNVTSINFSNVSERGIYYSTTIGFADGAGTKVSETGSFGTGVFTINTTGLNPGTVYYYKAFATNAAGTSYTTQEIFTTAASVITVTGTLVDFGLVKAGSNSTPQSYALSAVNLTNNLIITSSTGYQVSTASDVGYGTAITLIPVGGTVSTTTIYVRFSPGVVGSFIGNISNASTGATPQTIDVNGTGMNVPTLALFPGSGSITNSSALLSCNITDTNFSTVTERGFYYSTSNGFANGAGTKVSATGSFGTGSYSLPANGLAGNTTYYIKAFATNAAGTSYNNQASFITYADTYTVTLTSTPTDADILVGGVDSGNNTPYTFTMNYATSATYVVQKTAYTYAPSSYVVNNINTNKNQSFTGTQTSFFVDITSSPTDADIYLGGVDTGFNTPYQFLMEGGSSGTYSVQKVGYSYLPSTFPVTNITANTSQEFTGTQIAYVANITSTPPGAEIFFTDNVHGFDFVDTGFTTPHQFALLPGTTAYFYVTKPGYTWVPEQYSIYNIQADFSQNFVGTLLTYTVDITSTPADADIFVDGIDSNYNTPHQFTMDYGTNATYTVQKAGYSWAPASFPVTNIQANTSQAFTGTLLTYTVDITSIPSGANIIVGGLRIGTINTPYQFVMNYGASAVYSVQMPGYTFEPANFVVSNIQANTGQLFVGTILTYTVDITSTPTDADIFDGGVDTGFNSPHQFTLNYGTNATYTVQKAGYTWSPASFPITNIQANMSQNFTGTIITYTVDITSSPSIADIYVNGIDSGFNTPHQFIVNYGTNFTYTVQKAGYSWSPDSFPVTNIQANASQNFVGTLLTYAVNITSSPSDASILINGDNTGHSTPYTFIMDYGSSSTFSVEKTGYTWSPSSFDVTNIQENTGQLFTGTLLTYTVTINSNPPDADIFMNGVDTEYNTPHIFVMDYSSSATYTVYKEGYSFTPDNLVVTEIIESINQTFTGTILTYTVDITSIPGDADIFIRNPGATEGRAEAGDIDTGFNTPHQFTLEYGSDVTYFVEKPGYTWLPEEFAITNIQANTGQVFLGTIITYTVDITSFPTNADIYVDGVDSGHNTPYQFIMNYGTNATYTVQMAGYTWSPSSFAISNIRANTSQNFTGTILTYTVNIASNPNVADIFVDGVDSGFNTPHQFILNYGTGATYSVQKAGYTWSPESFAVSNIQANTSQSFTGTLITFAVDITSNPSDADIYINGDNTGYNTPYRFIMNYGSGANYSVQKDGYTWSPESFAVSNIQASTSQNFTGTIITYTVDITSNPSNADIFLNGQDSGFNTPRQFVMNYGTNATYSVQKAGYYWNPTNFVVTNIQANTGQFFNGTMITYTVDITSSPSSADIFEGGVDTGFNTPHQFILAQGAGGIYSVQKAGYSYTPTSYIVTNIQANTGQNFTGSILTYTVNITSTPADADIYVNGDDTGFNTPHQFILNYGSNATYSVQKEGYTWSPLNFAVTNIQANTSQNFIGTLIPYTVDITSSPNDANIFVNGQDSGFNTPHQFVMNYGTSATYSVQKAGYSWAPLSFAVNNIRANTAQMFNGTILTYTVDITSAPADADIFIGGIDTGLNTPHQFVMNYGTSATYTVQKTGYSFMPASFVVTEIQANATKNFVGSLLTYTVNITSTPVNADIYVGGTDSGFNTPHAFTLTYGSGAIYTVQKAGYIFTPDNFTVTNIQANTSQNFNGTILTFTVDITSTPTEADIMVNGEDTGFNTPYQFVMNYGTSAVYSVQKTGYTWTPTSFTVNNIQANTARNFVGSQITYNVNITSTPTNADVYIGNEDTGLNTPCQLVLPQGANATIRVKNVDYSWAPPSFVITNLQADASQHFVGTLLTYNVNVTSNPIDADIYVNGQDSGFNTPHLFVMNSSSSAVYSVQETGYGWTPANYGVYDIHADNDLMFTGAILTYTVNITSIPADANILINGVDSGYNTPYQFVMNYGSSATYSIQKAGYTWTPANFAVTNIQANTSQNFTGTLLTYTVNITSTPSDADILVGGVDSGFNTPHLFVMSYGSGAIYSVQKEGYVWTPANFVVTNIQANTAQEFTGATQTYTVDITSNPTNADIFIGGADSGFNTPYQFIMNHGASATYSVQKPEYIWSPSEFVVANIQANTSQNFVGSQIILFVTPANQNVPDLAGTTSFTVNSNIPWTVNETESWLSAAPLNSINNGDISVAYDANPLAVIRIGTITVSGGGITRTITVTQAGGLPTLTVTPNVQNVTYQTGVTTFTVNSNLVWTVSEAESWLSVAPLTGSNNGELTVAYEANEASSERIGVITVYGGGITVIVSVIQAGTPPTLTVTPEIQNVTYQAGTTSFAVNSNVAWTVSETVSWLSVSPAGGNNNGNIAVTYNANITTSARNGQIVITGGDIVQIVTVTQAGAPGALSVTPMLQNVSNFAGTTTFTVTSNTAWTVSESASWLAVSPVNGNLNGHFDVDFQTNPTPASRTGVITVAWAGSSLTVTVIQAAGVGIDDPTVIPIPAISVYPNPFATSANIKVDVTNNNNAELVVYSSKGELVKTLGIYSKGSYTLTWDGKDKAGRQVSNGFYLIRYKSADLTKTVKVLLIRN
jgi:hypothetical protein